jgi:hypothetical protein
VSGLSGGKSEWSETPYANKAKTPKLTSLRHRFYQEPSGFMNKRKTTNKIEANDHNTFVGITTPSRSPSKTDLITIVDPEQARQGLQSPETMTQEEQTLTIEESKTADPVSMICKGGRCNTSQRIVDPVSFARDIRKTLDKSAFNNTAVSKVNRILDKRACFSHFDVYNLNQMFGVPADIQRDIQASYFE